MQRFILWATRPFRRSQVSGYLAKMKDGRVGAKVRVHKVTLEQSVIILLAIVTRLEQVFRVDRRYLLNKALELDSAAKKDRKARQKAEERAVREQIRHKK